MKTNALKVPTNAFLRSAKQNGIRSASALLLLALPFGNYQPVYASKPIKIGVQQAANAITGKIVDEKNQPLIGVNVMVKGTNTGTVSDSNGEFTLENLPPNAVLVISYIAYETQEVAVTTKAQVTIVLKEDVKSLNELVVVGYGVQKKVNVTGSVAVIDAKQLSDRPITNATQALQGLQGVYVNQTSGQPGADGATIRIRGVGTIGGAGKLGALVLVDGVEYPMSAVNPADIESISVLKDAASSSIYGSRAANGVILITTKQGKKDRSSIDYNNYVGVQQATYLPDAVDNSADFMEWYNRAMVNQGGTPYYSSDLINEFRNNPTSLQYPNTNWMDQLFTNAAIHEHNLRFSGGTDKTSYSVSGNYLDQGGVLKNMTGAKRYSINLRVNSQLNSRIRIDAGIMASRWDKDEPKAGISTVMNRIMRMVPVQPFGKMENGNWPDAWVLTPGQNSFENPLVWGENAYQKQITDRIMFNIEAHVKLAEGLTYTLRTSANEGRYDMRNWNGATMMYNVFTNEPTRYSSGAVSSLSEYASTDQRLNATQILNFEKNIGSAHALNALVGYSVEKFSGRWKEASIQGFPTNDLQELSIGTANQIIKGTSYNDALLSYFGRIQYTYKNKYMAEVNSRYDGSSRFAKGNQWGFFPSVSLGWRLSEEDFMKDLTWINELKLRGSWGQIGNQEIGRFQYVNAVNLGIGYPFGGVFTPGSAVTQGKDPNLSWETTTMRNIGLDWSLLQGKLSGEFDYFHKRTSGILREVALPAQVGALGGPVRNLAVVDNRGFEVALNYNDKIGQDFGYQVGAHLTRIRNEVVDLKGETIISGALITKEGSAIDSWYVLKTDGLFRTQEDLDNSPRITNRVGLGDVKYVDLNEDGKIDGNDRYVAGNTFPDFTYGFTIGANYKGFNLTSVWQGVHDVSVRLNGNMAMPFNNGAGLTKNWITDSWTPENPNASLPRITTRHQYTAENYSDSDFWLYDASYLRLKNIQISYTFDKKVLEKIKVKQLKVFVNAQNALTFSKMKLFDPEQDHKQMHIGKYPSVKMFTAGLNVSF